MKHKQINKRQAFKILQQNFSNEIMLVPYKNNKIYTTFQFVITMEDIKRKFNKSSGDYKDFSRYIDYLLSDCESNVRFKYFIPE